MVTIDISIEDISRLMGYPEPLSVEELNEIMAFAISEVDSEPEGPDENGHTKVAIDIKTSNRPDLWGAEGIARVIRGRVDSPGLPPMDMTPSDYRIVVDAGLKEIRPYIGAAIVRSLKFDNFLIKQMIQIQDKVDFSFGRRRKRSSIGIYNINMIAKTINYTLKERSFKFQPLQFDHELTVDQIFEQHPKGKEYHSILDAFDKVPMLVDENGHVLSMPPIINSNDVGRVTIETTDVLVETTGTNDRAVMEALWVVIQALRDRGGKIETVAIEYPEGYGYNSVISPAADLIEMEIDPKKINTYLGTDFSPKKIIKLLQSRRLDAYSKNKKLVAQAPPWRQDILHWVDISEEIAIAADYNTIVPTKSHAVTIGGLQRSTEDENMVRSLLTGLQLIEIMSYTLTSLETLTDMVCRPTSWVDEHAVVLSNPTTARYNVLRTDLLPILIEFASKNTPVEYPQRIFEVGECAVKEKGKIVTKTKAAVLLAGAYETFETALSSLDAMLRLIGSIYTLEEAALEMYIPGRCARILIDGQEAGFLGEIYPQVLNNYRIEVPMSAFELDLSRVSQLAIKDLVTS